MHVVLLNQYYAPDEAATAQMLGDLGAALAAAGHEVTAICCDRSYADPSRRYPRAEVIDGVKVARAKSTGFGRGNALGRLADYATFLLGAVGRLLFGRRPDVVISLTTPPLISLAGTFCARLRGARSIFWSMDVYPDVAFELGAIRRGSIAGRLFSFLSRLTLRTPDVVVALGETMGEKLRALGARRVEVVHNWPATEGMSDLPGASHESITSSQLARSFAPPAHPPFAQDDTAHPNRSALVVMYSGNLGLAHEFETVLEAATRVEENASPGFDRSDPASTTPHPNPSPIGRGAFEKHPNPSFRFVFVGGGPRLGEVKRRAGELGLANVEFHPYVAREELGASLAAADVHLVTMREGMPGLLVPSKIYGIIAAGKPTLYVGPAAGEIHDIIVEGKCGTCVRNGDVDGVVAALRAYAQDRSLVEGQGRAAREIFERKFTKERSLGRYVKLVEEIGS